MDTLQRAPRACATSALICVWGITPWTRSTHYDGHVFERYMPKGIWHDRWLVVFSTTALCFCSSYLWSQQDIIDKSGFLGSLVGTANGRLRHAWGTLVEKIDRLIRGTKSAGRKARLPHYDERARLFSLYARTTERDGACLLSRV